MDERHTDCMTFDLWKIPGQKSLVHDGANVWMQLRTARESFDLHLDSELTNGKRFGYALPADTQLRDRQRAISRFVALCRSDRPHNLNVTLDRPSRSTLHHLQAIQALDGVSSGASQRDIAGALMGEDVATAEWSPDSALRAQLRSIIYRARALMNGGYRLLLTQGKRRAQGGIQ